MLMLAYGLTHTVRQQTGDKIHTHSLSMGSDGFATQSMLAMWLKLGKTGKIQKTSKLQLLQLSEQLCAQTYKQLVEQRRC